LVLVGFYFYAFHGSSQAISGDEPHYLAFARALSHHSFDVRAAYADPRGPSRWNPGLTTDQTVQVGNHLRSMRLPLLPLALAPAMRASSLDLVFLTMILIAIAFFDQLWRLLTDLRYRGAARLLPWLAALSALPVISYGILVSPEVPGALLVVIALRLLVRNTRRSLIAASAVASLLPWLIIRFAPLALGLVVAAAVMATRPDNLHPSNIWRAVRTRWRDALLVTTPFLISVALFAVYLQALYHSINPNATYPPGYTKPWSLWHLYEVGIGSLVGQGEGLLPLAPAFIVGIIGVVAAVRRQRAGWILLAAAAVYLFVVVPMGFWGAPIPGRFAVILVPLLVLGLAEVIRVIPPLQWAAVALIAAQLVITHGYHATSTLNGAPKYDYLYAFPRVDQEPGVETFGLPGTNAPAAGGPRTIYTTQPTTLRPGAYTVYFFFTNNGSKVPPAMNVGSARVTELPNHHVLATRSITAADLASPVPLEFRAPNQPVRWTNSVVIELDTTAATDLKLARVSGRPTPPLRSRQGVERDDVPLGLAWMAAFALGAAAVVIVSRRKRTDEFVSAGPSHS
jgi:hypothetical protein